MNAKWTKPFFVVAGIYDLILGCVFLFLAPIVFQQFGVEPPNHPGYLQFPSMLLILFAVMLFQISRDPIRNRGFIPYTMGMKAAYAITVFWNWFDGGIPGMWLPWAWADLVFLGLLWVAWLHTGKEAARTAP